MDQVIEWLNQPQEISLDVLAEKYLKAGETTEKDIFRRVAKAFASAERPELRRQYQKIFYENLEPGAIGAGRIMSAAGTNTCVTRT